MKSIKPPSSILVLGCGNSDFSALLYDDGNHRITNIDFSELVINEMKIKNSSRVSMRWLVQDMTNMVDSLTSIDGGKGFDIIFDKGALDALYSVDTTEGRDEAFKMFQQIHALMNIGSKYICITLAQDFIISALLHYFLQRTTNTRATTDDNSSPPGCYHISIRRLNNKVESSLLPFYIEIERVSPSSSPPPRLPSTTFNASSSSSSGRPSCVAVYIDQFSESIEHPQLFTSSDSDITSVLSLIGVIQNYYRRQTKLNHFQLGAYRIHPLLLYTVCCFAAMG